MVLANAESPVFLAPGFDVVASLWLDEDQAGEQRLAQVLSEAGFTRFRRATQTPFNLILEARP